MGIPTWRFDEPVAVIGDVHGEAALLDALLARLPPHIPLLFMGDLGDRGPDTRGVLDRLVDRAALGVQGNHDLWLTAWAAGEGFDPMALSPGMAGAATLRSYGVEPGSNPQIEAQAHKVPAAHRAWLKAAPVAAALEVGGDHYWLAHAGVPLSLSLRGRAPEAVIPWLAEHHPEALLWPKAAPQDMIPLDRPVIMGHVSLRSPVDTGSILAIDTGAGRGPRGALTALILPDRRFITVAA